MYMTRTLRPSTALRGPVLMLTALILVAVNLRLGVTSASALLTALTRAGALTPLTVVIVPALPTAVFALAGVGTARAAARLGTERTVLIGMIALTAGLMIRAVADPWVVVTGTVIATGGLAVVNILLPAVVREHFGRSIGPVTTAYTTTMSLGAAIAAAVAVPVAGALGSPTLGLAAWGLPALVGLVAWAVVMPRRSARSSAGVAARDARTARDAREAAAAPVGRARIPAGTGLLSAYFALQALLSYVAMGWLPTIAHDAGIPTARSGMLLGITMAVGVPVTAIIVSLARGTRRMRAGFLIVACSSAVALGGLLLAPAALPELWAALLGVGMCAFPLVLALIAGFGDDAAESALVSTIVQSTGYSIATVGPLGAGALRQLSGSWSAVLVLLIVCALVQGAIGLALTRVVAAKRRRAIPAGYPEAESPAVESAETVSQAAESPEADAPEGSRSSAA
ncbi:MFS transporter [Leucobacter zeae]|nr:MFS transporter [Leucobacter zeae]